MSRTPKEDRQVPAIPGDRVGRYMIVEEIGHGGMGVVFRATDVELGRDVALKFPWADLEESDHGIRRFRREAKSSSRLSHPNIVPVIEILEHKGSPCIVLQLVEGEDLRNYLKRIGSIESGRILRLSEDIGKGLAHAHSQRILHRDVNPKNIMITPEGRALLTDFGLARLLPGPEVLSADTTVSTSLTAKGAAIGTPRYMSPEQALGRTLDERSDIFSLGTVMYEMCTGSPAFSGGEMGELYDRIIHGAPKPISKFTSAVPAELERVIRKCMAKRPDERYQNVEDLLVDLRSLRRELDHETYPGSHGIGDRRGVDRRKGQRSIWIPALLALPLIAGGIWYAFFRDSDALPKGRPIQITSNAAWEGMPSLSPDGNQIAYVSNASGNLDIYLIGVEGGESLQLTDDAGEDRNPFWFPDGSSVGFASNRSGDWGVWKVGRFGGGPIMVVSHATYGAISPEGDRMAVETKTEPIGSVGIGLVDMIRPAEPRLLTIAEDGSWKHETPSWSPDGERICYADLNSLRLVSSDGGRGRRLIADGGPDFHPAWSPSGRHIYFSSSRAGTPAIWRLHISSGKLERVTMGTGPESWPDISADGKKLAYGTGAADRDVVLLDRERGLLTRIPGVSQVMAIGPRADRILFARPWSRGRVDLWELLLEGGLPAGPPRKLTDHPGVSTHPCLSPDGKWIAYYRVLEGQRKVWVIPARGGEPVLLDNDGGFSMLPVWSPDGSRLAYLSKRGGVWRVRTLAMAEGRATSEPRAITPAGMVASGVAWSPDGKSLAVVGMTDDKKEVFVIPAGGGSPIQITWGAEPHSVRWDPATGRLLVSGSWGGDRIRLRSIPSGGGKPDPLDPLIEFGGLDAPALFDIDEQGKLLIYSRSNLHGDIWLLATEEGSY